MVSDSRRTAALDIWAEVHGDDGYISVKLSPNDMAQRPYKQAHIPASLKPTLAYSMVRLSRPHPEDVFLDAMCGAGTILLERALHQTVLLLDRRRCLYRRFGRDRVEFRKASISRVNSFTGTHRVCRYDQTLLIKLSVISRLERPSEMCRSLRVYIVNVSENTSAS